MRVRLPLGRGLFFLAAFAFALFALMPLRLALDWFGTGGRGLAAREAEGCVWLGAVREARLGPLVMGDLQTRLRALPLLVGRARLDVKGLDGGFKGAVVTARHGFGIADVSGRLPVSGIPGIPVAAIDATDVGVMFDEGQCRGADGLVKASLGGALAGPALPSTLTGTARCEGGALLLTLASQSRAETLRFRLFADGRYEAELQFQPADPAAAERLRNAGFTAGTGGYSQRMSGRL
jgi:general secretion pathway protein N